MRWAGHAGLPMGLTAWACQGQAEPSQCPGVREQPSLNPLATVWSSLLCGLGVPAVDGTAPTLGPWETHEWPVDTLTHTVQGLDTPAGKTLS